MGCMNKKKRFENDAPLAHDLHDANRIIQEIWNQLREYEDRLAQSLPQLIQIAIIRLARS